MGGAIIEMNKMESMVSDWTEWLDKESLCLMSKIAREDQDYADLDVDLQLKLTPLWVATNGLNHNGDVNLKMMFAPHRRVLNTIEYCRMKM